MAFLFLTTRMRLHTGGLERLEVIGPTVREALQEAERRYPGVTEDLFEGTDLRAGFTIAINDTIVDHPLGILLEPTSEIYIVPAMGGG
jgi:molybdopterin converting factor small subunit